MADETTRRYLFVAIDRGTTWVFVRIMPAKTAANARGFLRDLHRACPIWIAKILTDNWKEFTDRLFASRARAPSGAHEFDQICTELGIEHRLMQPKSPQTNGMVERFNGLISDGLKTNRFDSALDLEQTLMRYVHLYNTQLPQSALRSRTPVQAMKDWHESHQHLFVKSPRIHPGRDSAKFSVSSVVSHSLPYCHTFCRNGWQVPRSRMIKSFYLKLADWDNGLRAADVTRAKLLAG